MRAKTEAPRAFRGLMSLALGRANGKPDCDCSGLLFQLGNIPERPKQSMTEIPKHSSQPWRVKIEAAGCDEPVHKFLPIPPHSACLSGEVELSSLTDLKEQPRLLVFL